MEEFYFPSEQINAQSSLIHIDYYSTNLEIAPVINTIIQEEEKNETIHNIIKKLLINFNDVDSGEDKKTSYENKQIILTSIINQKNNEDENYITMNFGNCENILKRDYNISNNDSLYILQIISQEEGMKIPKVEYEVYYPLYNNNLTKLNLTPCKNTKIEISISVELNDTIDKYNPKSDYYNDICSKATSNSGTDISLKDRKNEYINNNMSLCEEKCEFLEYNSNKGKVKCSCDIKLSIPLDYDIKFNKNDFLKSFTDIENILNINVMKCYRTVIKIKSLIKNLGFFIVGGVILLYFITLIIFLKCSYIKIKKKIYHIIFALKSHGNPIKKRQFTFKTPNNNKKDTKHHKKNIIKIYKNKNIAINVKGIYEGKSMNIEKLYYHKNPDSHSRLKE